MAEDAEEVEDESLMTQLSRAMGSSAQADANGEQPAPQEAPEDVKADLEAAAEKPAGTAAEHETSEAKEDVLDSGVPKVTYDEEKGNFTKDGRWILPKRSQFPSVFCALRVRVRLSPSGAADVNPWKLSVEEVEAVLRDLGLKDLVRFDDSRDHDAAVNAREVIVAVNGDLPSGLEVGKAKEVERLHLSATIVNVLDTADDLDPERISTLACRLKEGETADALVMELPQIWIISDPDFRAKSASIGLYPGSFWMGFLKSWGPVRVAEVFFRKTTPGDPKEPIVSVAVSFREREHLDMCFTFIHDRYLVHPKQKNALRQPWCRLATFEEFKAKTLGKPLPKHAAKKAQLQINRPHNLGQPPPVKKEVKTLDGFDRQLTPAEAMAGLSGRQLEAFQMVMSRMERLERENKELMQILLQMQGLWQQSQQRNEQANAARAPGVPGAQLDARQVPQPPAQGMPMPPPKQVAAPAPAPVFVQAPEVPMPPDLKRKADATAETNEGEDAPWKRLRRRQRRSNDPGDPASEMLESDFTEASDGDLGAGLAAYHNALLGI
ncbi:unnamed protein product [Effrenium voratum]|uniref:Uncharacterized protein n=1 Tax=Effrenium voratum TaxID=2562239 RepID=A0AA36IUR5_9DINO|nr:unnamed protein product [Effrenium voratum]